MEENARDVQETHTVTLEVWHVVSNAQHSTPLREKEASLFMIVNVRKHGHCLLLLLHMYIRHVQFVQVSLYIVFRNNTLSRQLRTKLHSKFAALTLTANLHCSLIFNQN